MMRGAKSRGKRSSGASGRNRRRLLLEPLCDRRVLAAITGTVFDDFNDSARRDAEEAGLADRLVYVDSNDDGQLSEGEPYRLTDSEGRFAFENLGWGDYSVRLYNGTSSQRQTLPTAPQWGEVLELKDGVISALSNDESQVYVLQGDSLVQWNLETGATTSLDLPGPIASIHPLPDGRVVALGESDAGLSGDAAWLISFADERVEAVDFGLAEGETGWSSMAIDGSGNGILLAAHSDGEPTPIRQLIWSDDSIRAIESSSNVVAGASALSHTDAVTSLIAVPNQDGLSLTLWSNATGTPIGEASSEVADGIGLRAFDEVAGIAVIEDSIGDLLILDASANMALLNRFTDLSGPVELDGHRERLYATDEAGDLVIQDLVNPEIRQTIAMSEAAVGGMVLVDGGRAAVIGHAEQLRRIRLDRPAGYKVSLGEEKESADLFFGLYLDGDNEAPVHQDEVDFELDEDTVLNLAAPALLNGAADPDKGDQFVLLRSSDPSFGTIQTSPTGRLFYQPAANFNGTDSFDVLLHDGRSISENMTVRLDILPVYDPIGPITFGGPIIPEDFEAGVPLGPIHIVNPDGHVVHIEVAHDDRFLIDGGQLILAEGAQLDYEHESEIYVELHVYEGEDGEQTTATILLQVEDVPEEIIGLELFNLKTIPEGIYSQDDYDPWRQVATVHVVDLDEDGTYRFELSDPRFEVVDRRLLIVDDSEFDYEEEPEIDLTIHAYDLDGPFDFAETFTITIDDVNELPTTASFSDDAIIERVAGVTVGDVFVDDPDQPSTVQFSVDDSRFEFDGPTLKLRDGVFVERSQQEQIHLTLTVADYAAAGEFVHTIDVTLDVLENASPFHNNELYADVNGDGTVEPLDALMIINYLNSHGPGPIEEAVNSGHAEYYYDVNDDGLVTPLDALLVINYLNQIGNGSTSTVGGEGEPKLAPPETGPEGESVARKLVQTLSVDQPSVANHRKPATPAPLPSSTPSPPTRANDLAVEALSKESGSLPSEDDAFASLKLVADRADRL